MKKLHLFTRKDCIKSNTFKNFAERYQLEYTLHEQGDHAAEIMALDLKVHNVPQFIVEEENIFTPITIEEVIAIVDEGEFLKPERTEQMVREELGIDDFYEE